jgi:hypothetical protein
MARESPPKSSDGARASVYQLRISIRDIRPPIWRRILVPGTLRLSDLHHVIQTVFGWTNSHLHRFTIADRRYGQPDEFDETALDEADITVSEVLGADVKHFSYAYDFGDDWEHEVVIEKTLGGNSGRERPLCLAGRRHRPPEDCGGPRGYRDFLAAIRNPRHREHQPMIEWIGGHFDSEAFDLESVNRELARLPLARKWVQ